jgi:protein arginine kinase activator
MDEHEKAEASLAKDTPIERPLECSECHRPIKVLYTEVIGKNSTTYHMCSECPVLHSKLQGQTIFGKEASCVTPLCCGSCGLSSEDLRKGSMLGCSLCYDIFKDEIIHELNAQKRIPEPFADGNDASLHVGRRAGTSAETSLSLQLSTLQQALHDTLGREDYEQAAYLRDQIKALEERNKTT